MAHKIARRLANPVASCGSFASFTDSARGGGFIRRDSWHWVLSIAERLLVHVGRAALWVTLVIVFFFRGGGVRADCGV